MQLIQVILQCHCNNDLKNMHSMLFLKSPACSRNDPYPHHERDLPHATPLLLLLHPTLLDFSGKLQSQYIPSSQADSKKKKTYPHHRRDVPHAPPPLPL